MKSPPIKQLLPYTATTLALMFAGVVFMVVCGEQLPGRLGTFLGGVLVTTSVIATVSDLNYRKIWNSTTFSALFIIVVIHGIVYGGFVSEGTRPALGVISTDQAFLGGAVCLVLTGLPFLVTHKGAGDVKLAVVSGAVLGPLSGIAAVVLAYLLAACLLASFYFMKSGVLMTVRSVLRLIFSWILPLWIAQPGEEEQALLKSSIPLAPGFCLAAIIMLYRN